MVEKADTKIPQKLCNNVLEGLAIWLKKDIKKQNSKRGTILMATKKVHSLE